MGIDMRGFRVIYKNVIYNAINIMPFLGNTPNQAQEPEKLEVWVLNADGVVTILRDNITAFQFVRIVEEK